MAKTEAKRRPPGSGRAVILRAARDTFAAQGFDGASIRDIAQTAGLNLSALYYYFESKQAALYELICIAYERFNASVADALAAADPDPAARVVAFVRVLVRYRAFNRASSRVLLLETERLDDDYREDVLELRQQTREQLYEDVRRGAELGAFRVSDPDLAARSVLAICNVIPQWWTPDGPLTVEDLEREYVEQTLRILDCSDRSERLFASALPEIPSEDD